jgi:hypothetical protein
MRTFKEYMEERDSQLLEEGLMNILKRLGLPLVLAGSLMMTASGCVARNNHPDAQKAAAMVNKTLHDERATSPDAGDFFDADNVNSGNYDVSKMDDQDYDVSKMDDQELINLRNKLKQDYIQSHQNQFRSLGPGKAHELLQKRANMYASTEMTKRNPSTQHQFSRTPHGYQQSWSGRTPVGPGARQAAQEMGND